MQKYIKYKEKGTQVYDKAFLKMFPYTFFESGFSCQK